MKVNNYHKDLLRFAYGDFWTSICDQLNIGIQFRSAFAPQYQEKDRFGNEMGSKRIDRFLGWACCQPAKIEDHCERMRLIKEYFVKILPLVKSDFQRQSETIEFFKKASEQRATEEKEKLSDDQLTFDF